MLLLTNVHSPCKLPRHMINCCQLIRVARSAVISEMLSCAVAPLNPESKCLPRWKVPRSFLEIAASQPTEWLNLKWGPKEFDFREAGASWPNGGSAPKDLRNISCVRRHGWRQMRSKLRRTRQV